MYKIMLSMLLLPLSLQAMNPDCLDKELFFAAKGGDSEKVEKLIIAGANPNTMITDNADLFPIEWTALNRVTKELNDARGRGDSTRLPGLKEVIKLLLTHHADCNIANKHGETPLYWAVVVDDKELTKVLLRAGAKPFVHSTLGECTTFCIAAFNHNKELMNILLNAHEDMDVDINQASGSQNYVPLTLADNCSCGGCLHIALMLNNYSEVIQVAKDEPLKAFNKAIVYGFEGLAKALLTKLVLTRQERVEVMNKAVAHGLYDLVERLIGELALEQEELSTLGWVAHREHFASGNAIYKKIGALLSKQLQRTRAMMGTTSYGTATAPTVAAIIAQYSIGK